MAPHRLWRYFRYKHLPPRLQEISKEFHNLAEFIDLHLFDPDAPTDKAEATVALRKLLEAKDAAVRAYLREED